MKQIYITNIPAVGTCTMTSFMFSTSGATLAASIDDTIDYTALTAGQKTIVDDFVAMAYSKAN